MTATGVIVMARDVLVSSGGALDRADGTVAERETPSADELEILVAEPLPTVPTFLLASS